MDCDQDTALLTVEDTENLQQSPTENLQQSPTDNATPMDVDQNVQVLVIWLTNFKMLTFLPDHF